VFYGANRYWLLACVIVVAGLLREVAVRAWKRLFAPSPLHLAQEDEQRKRNQHQHHHHQQQRAHVGSNVGDAAIEMQTRGQA
jgi:hypothetical protein